MQTVLLVIYLATLLIQSYQVFNSLAQIDSSDYDNYYADVNYAFCVIIFGQVIGIMCAKMARLLSTKKEAQETQHLMPDTQILIADIIYLTIVCFLN